MECRLVGLSSVSLGSQARTLQSWSGLIHGITFQYQCTSILVYGSKKPSSQKQVVEVWSSYLVVYGPLCTRSHPHYLRIPGGRLGLVISSLSRPFCPRLPSTSSPLPLTSHQVLLDICLANTCFKCIGISHLSIVVT